MVINGKNSPGRSPLLRRPLAGGGGRPLWTIRCRSTRPCPRRVRRSILCPDAAIINQLNKEASWVKNLKGIVSTNPDRRCRQLHNSSAEEDGWSGSNARNTIWRRSSSPAERPAMKRSNAHPRQPRQRRVCMRRNLQISEVDVLYALLPLHHSYSRTAVLLESITHGSEVRHDIVVSKMINDMKRGKITVFMGIPLLQQDP